MFPDFTRLQIVRVLLFFSLYRVSLVALGSDPQYGDSSPSNVLKLCTPVAEDRQAMTSRPSGPLTRIFLDIHVSSIANTRIAFEWSHPPEMCKLSRALCLFCGYCCCPTFFFIRATFFLLFSKSGKIVVAETSDLRLSIVTILRLLSFVSFAWIP